jgi:hypothetical protein
MPDYPFYGGSPPHVAGSATSAEAASEAKPSAAVWRARVFTFIEGKGTEGATDEEVQHALALGGNTQRPRRCELVESGRVRDSGDTRLTKARRSAVVWVAVPPEEQAEAAQQAAAEAKRAGLEKRVRKLLPALSTTGLQKLLQILEQWADTSSGQSVNHTSNEAWLDWLYEKMSE